MRRRRLGRSELSISEIGFGTGDNAGAMVQGSDAEQRAIVGEALDAGITYFDCSPDYGKGLGEANLGRILRDMGRTDDVVIATKVELMPEQMGRVQAAICESAEASLVRLRRSWVDVLMIHNPPRRVRDPSVRKWMPLTPGDLLGECMEALRSLRERGLVRHLGVACEHAEPAAVGQVLSTGELSVANVLFNMENPTADWAGPVSQAVGEAPSEENYSGLLQTARSYGVGVAVMRPLAGGVLTQAVLERGLGGRHPLSGTAFVRDETSFNARVARAAALARTVIGQHPLEDCAYRFVLDHPAVTTVLCGFSCVEHVRAAVRAASQPPFTQEEMAAVAASIERGLVR